MARHWDDATGIVTPEAVRLQFQEANVGSRGVAALMDGFLLFSGMMLVNLLLAGLAAVGSTLVPAWVAVTILIVVNFLLFLGYPVAFETLQGGKTPGKSAMGLRVVTVEGSPISFRHAAIRGVLGLVDFYITFGMGAVFATLFSRRHQRLGDMVAGTIVLRDRVAEPPPWALRFTVPPGAESYAMTLDASVLSPRDYEVVRSFLLRARGLAPGPRRELGQRLATALAARLHHTPPPTVSAELFLSCLVARYQERHWAPPGEGAVQPGLPPPQPPAQQPVAPEQAHRAGQPLQPQDTWGDFSPPS